MGQNLHLFASRQRVTSLVCRRDEGGAYLSLTTEYGAALLGDYSTKYNVTDTGCSSTLASGESCTAKCGHCYAQTGQWRVEGGCGNAFES